MLTGQGGRRGNFGGASPPLAAGELPFHEVGELRLGDVRVRVPATEKRRKLLAVEGVEVDEVGFVEGLEASRVGRESLPP